MAVGIKMLNFLTAFNLCLQRESAGEVMKEKSSLLFFRSSSSSFLPSFLHMDPEKTSQFYSAAVNGNLPLVQELSKDPKVNLNWRNPAELLRTPFDAACRYGDLDLVRFFLGLPGLDPNLPQKEKATPFYIAVQNGHVEVVSLLLADERIQVNNQADEGESPFFVACQNGHVEIVSLMLGDKRVDVNAAKNTGSTPLWFASKNGHLPVVQAILASGREVDVMKRSRFNRLTAAEHARARGGRAVKDYNESDVDFQRKIADCPKIAELIDDFVTDPETVRLDLRRTLRLDGKSPWIPTFFLIL